jgi:hypothetical protein
MGVDLLELTADSFEPHRGSTFVLDGAQGPVFLVLASVTRRAAVPGFRAPFSLEFHLPRGSSQQQAIHTLTHATLGTVDIFLVPIQPSPTHARYEAVFG